MKLKKKWYLGAIPKVSPIFTIFRIQNDIF